jgi:Tol biopolymer transport system component
LQKDRNRRLRHTGDALVELDESTGTSGEPAVPAKSTGRERVFWAASLLIVSFLAVTLTWTQLRAPSSTVPTVHFTITAPQGEMRQAVGTAPLVSISPDGRYIAVVAGIGGDFSIWIRSIDSVHFRKLAGTEAAQPLLFWSPDSKAIGFFSGGKLKKIEMTGSVSTLCDALGGRGGAWSSKGVILFANGREIRKVFESGGESTIVTRLDIDSSHNWPHFLPDGNHFLFFGNPSKTVWIGSLDSAEQKALTKSDSFAAFTETGELLFVRQGVLMAQAFDPKALELLAEPRAIAQPVPFLGNGLAAFAVGGSEVLAYSQGYLTGLDLLVWRDRSGKELQRFPASANYDGIDLAPDEKRVAAHIHDEGGDVWVMDFSRGTSSRLTFTGIDSSNPVWSPDGTRIAFDSNKSGADDIFVKSASGAGDEVLVVTSMVNKRPFDWSPDGRSILYVDGSFQGGGKGVIWSIDANGQSQPQPVLKANFDQSQPQLSPDGRWLAYSSAESGRHEIYVQTYPPSLVKLQISTNGGGMPRWREDGRELFYISPDRKLMSVSISSTGSELKPGVPQALFQTAISIVGNLGSTWHDYSTSRDGQRFLIVEYGEAPESSAVQVIVNRSRAR